MLKQIKNLKNNNEGFSLLELLVAITILATIVMSLVQLFPFGAMIVKSSENKTRSLYIAQSQIEKLISQDYFSINTGNIETRHKLSSSTAPYLANFERETNVYYTNSDFTATSTNPIDDQGLKIIKVKVYYNNPISINDTTYELNYLLTRR